jgi:hypothetical protein
LTNRINIAQTNGRIEEQVEVMKDPAHRRSAKIAFPKRCALRERPAKPSAIIPSRADARS